MMLHPMSNPLLSIFQDYLFPSHVSGKCFNGCASKAGGYLGCGMWGYVGVVGVCTPLQRFHNMLTWKTTLHPCVLMWFHMVLMWQDGDVAMGDMALM
jgi:hypothetical protein